MLLGGWCIEHENKTWKKKLLQMKLWNKKIQVDTPLDLQFAQIREAGVSGNGKIAEAIVGKIYDKIDYNIGGHAGHIGEEIVTKIPKTHNI